MTELEVIYLPKETVSDDRYKVLTVSVASGMKVAKNQVLLEFQTSKATMELVSPTDGYFHTWVEPGQELPVGAALGVISPNATVPQAALAELRTPSMQSAERSSRGEVPEVRFSKAADDLVVRHGLGRELFAGIKLVRREDVERVLAAASTADEVTVQGDSSSVIIVGGGGHAKICIDIIRLVGTFNIVGIVDEKLQIGEKVLGVPVIGRDSDLSRFYVAGVRLAVCGLGATSNHPARTTLFAKIKAAGFQVPNLIHPAAVVEASARLGEGNQVMAGAIIGSDVTVADNCIVNAGAVVAHESTLADNVHIAPGAILGGNVRVGSDTLIGMGATIYLGLTIGSRVIVTNGMNVFAPVADGTILRH